MEQIDVLIVGAGPSGLTMAAECERYGLSCRIIEQSKTPSPHSRAIAIQARTLETFQRMDIHNEFLKAGIPIKGGTIHSGHTKQAHINLTQIPSPFPFALSLEQNRTEEILTNVVTSRGIKVEREVALISFQQNESGIAAQTTMGPIAAKYLIGCDGAHSIVRKTLGCTFEGKSFEDVFSLADVKIDWNYPHDEISVFLEAEGIVAAFPLPEEGRYRLIFQLKRLRELYHGNDVSHGVLDEKEIEVPTLEEIQTLLQNSTHQTCEVTDPKWIANFHINSRLSNKYQEGKIFLIGDAAHIHSPVGGQGMNTGIQDAFNLAWKLGYVHHNRAGEEILDTYEKERHSVGKRLLAATEKASSMVSLHSPFLIMIRNFFLSKLLPLKSIHRKIIEGIAELDFGYPERRVPNHTAIIDGKEIPYFEATEGCTQYHLLYNGDTPPAGKENTRLIKIKEPLPRSPLLVRPDGYPVS